jgi:hypothetical protein
MALQHISTGDCARHLKSLENGTDYLLWNGIKEDGDVRSECEEDEGTDCEDGDSDIGW